MELVKSTKEFKVYKKANGRHAVQAKGKLLSGEKKAEALVKAGILKHASKKKAEEKATE